MIRLNKIELLYKSFEGDLPANEQQQLDLLLLTDPEIQKMAGEVAQLRSRLRQEKSAAFSEKFTVQIMNRIQSINIKSISSTLLDEMVASFKPIAFASLFVILLLSTMNFMQLGQVSICGIFSAPEITINEIIVPANELITEYK